MTRIDRRTFTSTALASLFPIPARAAAPVTDSAGRTVALPDRILRVMAAGPPASVVVYCLTPDKLLGWQRALRTEEKPYLLPLTHDLPELGRLTGRGDTANIEVVLKAKPDVIVDFGSITPTYVSLANATQERTGVPYLLVDGRFTSTAPSLRLLGQALGVVERGETLAAYAEDLLKRVDAAVASVPEAQRPSIYLARGPEGLETGLKGSINTEIIERAGGRNVADPQDGRRGIANVSPEQILLWKPDVVITWDRNFFAKVTQQPDSVWQTVPAVADKRVYLAPTAPFGWIDGPPSINRLIGLAWLANLFNGGCFAFDIAKDTRAFYKLFYQVDVSDTDLATLVAWADGRPPRPPKR
jgi:iron complex transport system substrate-binding protein